MTDINELLEKVTDAEQTALMAWRDTSVENNVLPFRLIGDWSGTPTSKVRRITRSLARKGFLELTTGFSDEGMIMGRGYMPTSTGMKAISALIAKESSNDQ